jgi:hypothetical protein
MDGTMATGLTAAEFWFGASTGILGITGSTEDGGAPHPRQKPSMSRDDDPH